MTPFAPGSVSLGLHPVSELGAGEIVDDILEQARLAESVGLRASPSVSTTPASPVTSRSR